MSAQQRTLDQYHELMHINAVSHLIRTARRVGLFDALNEGQRTADQLREELSLRAEPAGLLLDALVASGIIEKYGDDYALSQAARLLCQYDEDLGDRRWERFVDHLLGNQQDDGRDDRQHLEYLAATQWIHTPAAMQAAEILDIGGVGEVAGPSILELGCGSAVWSCAMAHRDPAARVTLVDHAGALAAAMATAQSIGMADRVITIEGDPATAPLPTDEFDIVLIAQRLHASSMADADALLDRAVRASKPGGRVVVIDLFRGPARPTLAESIEALKLELETTAGRMRTVEEVQAQMGRHGLQRVQFTFLAASRINLALAVGRKPG